MKIAYDMQAEMPSLVPVKPTPHLAIATGWVANKDNGPTFDITSIFLHSPEKRTILRKGTIQRHVRLQPGTNLAFLMKRRKEKANR